MAQCNTSTPLGGKRKMKQKLEYQNSLLLEQLFQLPKKIKFARFNLVNVTLRDVFVLSGSKSNIFFVKSFKKNPANKQKRTSCCSNRSKRTMSSMVKALKDTLKAIQRGKKRHIC